MHSVAACFLYLVSHCAATPSVKILQDPAELDWQPVVKVEHYRLMAESVEHRVTLKESPGTYKTEADG